MADDSSESSDADSDRSSSESAEESSSGTSTESNNGVTGDEALSGAKQTNRTNAASKGDTAEKGAGKKPSGEYESTTAIPGSIPRSVQPDADSTTTSSSSDDSGSSDDGDGSSDGSDD